jgi:hypothetical protein
MSILFCKLYQKSGAMKILKELSRSEFQSKYSTEKACYKLLADLKWESGYNCSRCEASVYIKGKQHHSRRCSKCGYDESPTSGTLFHKLKFGVLKAFEMIYEISTSKKGASSIWLAERFGVNQKTAWLFRQKVQSAMESSQNYPLNGEVHVDEFEIGGPQEGEQGRSKSEKKVRLVIAVENREGKAGRAYAKVIEDFSTKSLKSIFEEHIAKDAKIVTDKWPSYNPIKEDYPKLTQVLSNKGLNFAMLHVQIINFKRWLKGVHAYCEPKYVQKYLNEYFFRFNRRNHRATILDKILERVVVHKPLTAKMIRAYDN